MLSPIVLFVYNRPRHVAECLTYLSACDGASGSLLYIYSDGAKGSGDADAVAQVRQVCREAKGFAEVRLCEREHNVGLAENIISGVTAVVREWGRVIVLEDDLHVSPFFLRYMNTALDYYQNRGVFSVSGYTPEVEMPRDYQHSTYVMHRNCSWGWGTWRECWEKVDWQVRDFDAFIRSSRQRSLFNACGNDLSPMLLRWKIGEISSWSIRFCYAGFKAGMPTVYPRKSLVRNNGADGSGQNVPTTQRYNTPMAANVGLANFLPGVAPDPELTVQFRTFYNTSLIRQVINLFKRLRYTLFRA